MFCAAGSASVWDSVIAARVPVIFRRFAEIVADVLLAEGGDEGLRGRLVGISDEPVRPKYCRAVTPVAVAVRVLAEARVDRAEEWAGAFKRLAGKTWRNLGNADFVRAVKALPRKGDGPENALGEECLTRIRKLLAHPAQAAARISPPLTVFGPATVAALHSEQVADLGCSPQLTSHAKSRFPDARTPESLYRAAGSARLRNSLREMTVAANEAKKEGRHDLIAAIYVAYPRVFAREMQSSTEIVRAVCGLPGWFRGPVDETIDCALRSLMASVRGVSAVYSGLMKLESRRNAERSLKRACVGHPAIVYRRIDDLCAVGFVLLEGLPDPNDRYEEGTLATLGLILRTIADVQRQTKGRSGEVLKVAIAGKDFLLDEGRGHNGIPAIFGEVVECVLALLDMYPAEVRERGMGEEFVEVIKAGGTGGELRRVFARFLGRVRVRLPFVVDASMLSC